MIILSYIVLSVLLMSFIEWSIHKYVMHKELWPLSKEYRNHTLQHHGRFYQTFNYEEDEVGRQFGLKLSILWNLIAASPILIIMYLICPLFCYIFIGVVIFHHLTWNVIHDEMHNETYGFIKYMPGYKFLEWHHYLHHRHVNKNFNIVFPIFDYVMGTVAKPTDKDLEIYASLHHTIT